jgi:hypothetical protein
MAGNTERKGVVEGYKNLNRLTRNGALIAAPLLVVLGFGGLATVALASAAVDHGQIKAIEWWQNRKNKPVTMKQNTWYVLQR